MYREILRRLKALEAKNYSRATIICLFEGKEQTMNLLEALCKGAVFVRTISGKHEYDELYRAALIGGEEDFSDILEAK